MGDSITVTPVTKVTVRIPAAPGVPGRETELVFEISYDEANALIGGLVHELGILKHWPTIPMPALPAMPAPASPWNPSFPVPGAPIWVVDPASMPYYGVGDPAPGLTTNITCQARTDG